MNVPPELIEFISRFTLFGMPAVGLVIVLVEIAKRVLGLPSKYAPLASIVGGIVICSVIGLIDVAPWIEPIFMYILAGILTGAAAAGFYAGTRALFGYKSAAPDTRIIPKEAVVAPPNSTVTLPGGATVLVGPSGRSEEVRQPSARSRSARKAGGQPGEPDRSPLDADNDDDLDNGGS